MQLYLIKETIKARHFSRSKAGWPSFWIPRSVVSCITKFPPAPLDGPFRRCDVTIEPWWLEKNPLPEEQP